MNVAIPKALFPGERRVALVPSGVALLTKLSLHTKVEAGAGLASGFTDDAYRHAGAEVLSDRDQLLGTADIVLHVQTMASQAKEADTYFGPLNSSAAVIGMADPLGDPAGVQRYAEQGNTLMGLELLPRITRAQSMDVLSSMATIAGYKAALLAADTLPRLFPLLMTAAGTLAPAKVLVIGAGVAGLQAIATAKRLGAVVQAYDVRPAAREQIESLGAHCVQLDLATDDAEEKSGYAKALSPEQEEQQRQQLADVVAECDVVITTAAIPGRPSPLLVTEEGVRRMAPGSVLVDLAAERGGNCALTQADQTIVEQGVTILGPTNLPAMVPQHASQMYSKNLTNFLGLIVNAGRLDLQLDDPIIHNTLLTRDGQIVNERVRQLVQESNA